MVNGRTGMKFKKIRWAVAEFRVNGRNGLVGCGKSRLERDGDDGPRTADRGRLDT
jgi:hypothetical protein